MNPVTPGSSLTVWVHTGDGVSKPAGVQLSIEPEMHISGLSRRFHTVRLDTGEVLRCPGNVGPTGNWNLRSRINQNWWRTPGAENGWCCPHGTLMKLHIAVWKVTRDGPCPFPGSCGYPDADPEPISDEVIAETGKKLLALLNRMENSGNAHEG